MTRKQAITNIIANVAESGDVDKLTMRIYVENRLSYQAFNDAVRKGKDIFNQRKAA